MKLAILFAAFVLISISPALSQKTKIKSVKIGNQVWMAENLNVDKFRNGDPIPHAKTDEEWKKAGENKQPAWCYYENRSVQPDPINGTKYGKLYNWYAVADPRGLCPAGWHVPTDYEWPVLKDYLDALVAKSTGGGSITCPNCVNWNDEYRRKVPCHTCKDTRSVDAPKVTTLQKWTEFQGFSGLPGGLRYNYGTFNSIGNNGYWWCSSELNSTNAWYLTLYFNNGNVYRASGYKRFGLSVRCLRD